MSGKDNGDDMAFPGTDQRVGDGLSKREWFAGQALVGYLAFNPGGEPTTQSDPDVAARKAVKFADALLAELAKPHPQDRR